MIVSTYTCILNHELLKAEGHSLVFREHLEHSGYALTHTCERPEHTLSTNLTRGKIAGALSVTETKTKEAKHAEIW